MTLAHTIEEYVTVKRATGLRFRSAATILRTFARVAGVMEINDVTQETVRAFLKGSGPITSGWHQKHYTLAGLFRFAMQRGLMSTSPVTYRLPKRPAYATPYIYSEEELRRMLDATVGAGPSASEERAACHDSRADVSDADRASLRRRASPRRSARAHPR
jgi:site-specific recombinase XerD